MNSDYITNYDYIVYMDLEELAKAIDSDFNNTPWCNDECSDKCIECIIKWLKEKRDC